MFGSFYIRQMVGSALFVRVFRFVDRERYVYIDDDLIVRVALIMFDLETRRAHSGRRGRSL